MNLSGVLSDNEDTATVVEKIKGGECTLLPVAIRGGRLYSDAVCSSRVFLSVPGLPDTGDGVAQERPTCADKKVPPSERPALPCLRYSTPLPSAAKLQNKEESVDIDDPNATLNRRLIDSIEFVHSLNMGGMNALDGTMKYVPKSSRMASVVIEDSSDYFAPEIKDAPKIDVMPRKIPLKFQKPEPAEYGIPCRLCIRIERIRRIIAKEEAGLKRWLKSNQVAFMESEANREAALNLATETWDKLKTNERKMLSFDRVLSGKLSHLWAEERKGIVKDFPRTARLEKLKKTLSQLGRKHPKCAACKILFGEKHCEHPNPSPYGDLCSWCHHGYRKYPARFRKNMERQKKYEGW